MFDSGSLFYVPHSFWMYLFFKKVGFLFLFTTCTVSPELAKGSIVLNEFPSLFLKESGVRVSFQVGKCVLAPSG
jgi:hypothetical protein